MSEVLDRRELRGAFGAFATGITVITAEGGGRDVGTTVNSFSSVSLSPALLLCCLGQSSSSLEGILSASGFAVHVLHNRQKEISDRFARSGGHKFEGLDLERGHYGAPLLKDFSARFECRTVDRHVAGDHIILVGEVLSYDRREAEPLLFFGGRYGDFREFAIPAS